MFKWHHWLWIAACPLCRCRTVACEGVEEDAGDRRNVSWAPARVYSVRTFQRISPKTLQNFTAVKQKGNCSYYSIRFTPCLCVQSTIQPLNQSLSLITGVDERKKKKVNSIKTQVRVITRYLPFWPPPLSPRWRSTMSGFFFIHVVKIVQMQIWYTIYKGILYTFKRSIEIFYLDFC